MFEKILASPRVWWNIVESCGVGIVYGLCTNHRKTFWRCVSSLRGSRSCKSMYSQLHAASSSVLGCDAFSHNLPFVKDPFALRASKEFPKSTTSANDDASSTSPTTPRSLLLSQLANPYCHMPKSSCSCFMANWGRFSLKTILTRYLKHSVKRLLTKPLGYDAHHGSDVGEHSLQHLSVKPLDLFRIFWLPIILLHDKILGWIRVNRWIYYCWS